MYAAIIAIPVNLSWITLDTAVLTHTHTKKEIKQESLLLFRWLQSLAPMAHFLPATSHHNRNQP